MQRVYLPVQRTLGYKVSFYAKHLSGPATLTVSLRQADADKVFTSTTVEAKAGAWTKYNATPEAACRHGAALGAGRFRHSGYGQ